MDKKLLKKLGDVPCHNKRKNIQIGILQLRNLCVSLGISVLVIVYSVIEYILIERNQLPFMIHPPALPVRFKAEHIDSVGRKPSSMKSFCQSMDEQAVVWHSFTTDFWKVMLENSRMSVRNEQTHTNRKCTLHIKCKIRILINIAVYTDGNANIDVELYFVKSQAEGLKSYIIYSIICNYYIIDNANGGIIIF